MSSAAAFIASHLPGAKPHGDGWQARCPAHDDARPSLSVSSGEGGRVLLYCHAGCSTEAVLQALSLSESDLFPPRESTSVAATREVAQYIYHDAEGVPAFRVVRYEPKTFRQHAADGQGGWLPTRGNAPDLVFQLPAIRGRARIAIVEGEKDVMALRALGIPATCNAGGSGKWRQHHTLQIQSAGVSCAVLVPDNDKPGEQHMHAVAASLRAVGIAVHWCALPDLPPKGDVSDALSAGMTKATLLAHLRTAPVYTPPADLALVAPTTEDDRQQRATDQAYERERATREARRRLDAEDHRICVPSAIETLRQRLLTPLPAAVYRIDRLQPLNTRVILSAVKKAGKTTFTGNLIRSLVDGSLFLGEYTVLPPAGPIVLLDFEMDRRQLDRWLGDQGIDGDDRLLVQSMRGQASSFNILDPHIRQQWATLLRVYRPSYLIADCLRPILDALGLDENKDCGRFLVAFDALLHEAEIPDALLVHHMGHGQERSRGDSRLRDWPDVEWRLKWDDNPDSPRYFDAYGRDVQVEEGALSYDRFRRRLLIAGGSRRDHTAAAALKEIVAFLADRPAQTTSAIEMAFKDTHGRNVVRQAIQLGIDDGLIATEPGRNNATLHKLRSVSVRQFATVRQSPPSEPVRQCASSPIGRAHARPIGEVDHLVGSPLHEEVS